MDRRAFSFSFASLSLASASLARAESTSLPAHVKEPLLGASTFTQVGK
jgi:hypothetical protein